MKKKLTAIMVAAFMVGSMAACSVSDNTVSDTASSTTYTASTQTDNETVESTSDTAATVAASTQQTDAAAEYTANTTGKIDTTDLFSKRDLEQSPDVSDAKTITAADGKTETITEEGVYVITGSAKNFTIKVEADKEAKVQLVLDGVNITNDSFPVVYVVSADKCFITTTDSENTLSVTGTFTSDGDTNTDAVIYSKDDLVFNGTGTLTISSENGNGISGKDDIKVTGGTYHITSALDSIEANDSIAIYDGTFEITSSKDGLHSENSEDDTKG